MLCIVGALETMFPPILEEAQCLMGPDTDQSLHWQSLKGPQCLKDAPDPARHLSGGVDIVGLGILCETFLWLEMKKAWLKLGLAKSLNSNVCLGQLHMNPALPET